MKYKCVYREQLHKSDFLLIYADRNLLMKNLLLSLWHKVIITDDAADSSALRGRLVQGVVLIDCLWWSDVDVITCSLVFIMCRCRQNMRRQTFSKVVNVYCGYVIWLGNTQLPPMTTLLSLKFHAASAFAGLIYHPPATSSLKLLLPVGANLI